MKTYTLKCWTGRKQKRTFHVDLKYDFRTATVMQMVKKAVREEHPEIKQMKRCRLELK